MSFRIQLSELSESARQLAVPLDTGAPGLGEEDLPAIARAVAAHGPDAAEYQALLDGVSGRGNAPVRNSVSDRVWTEARHHSDTAWGGLKPLSSNALKAAGVTERIGAVEDVLQMKGFRWYNYWAGVNSETKTKRLLDLLEATPNYQLGKVVQALEADDVVDHQSSIAYLSKLSTKYNLGDRLGAILSRSELCLDAPSEVALAIAQRRDFGQAVRDLASLRGSDFTLQVLQSLDASGRLTPLFMGLGRVERYASPIHSEALDNLAALQYEDNLRFAAKMLRDEMDGLPQAPRAFLIAKFEAENGRRYPF